MKDNIVFIHVHHIYTVINAIDKNHIFTLYERKYYIYSCTPYLHSNYSSEYEPQLYLKWTHTVSIVLVPTKL